MVNCHVIEPHEATYSWGKPPGRDGIGYLQHKPREYVMNRPAMLGNLVLWKVIKQIQTWGCEIMQNHGSYKLL